MGSGAWTVGSAVTWIQPGLSGGVQRTHFTRLTSEIQRVDCNDGRTLDCVTLENNRFVPVAQLRHGHVEGEHEHRSVGTDIPAKRERPRVSHAIASQPSLSERRESLVPTTRLPSADGSRDTPAVAGSGDCRDTVRESLPEYNPNSHRGAVDESATDRSVNVLAIDFLNLLVRAWHAGKRNETHAVRSLFQTVANAIRNLSPSHVVFAMDGGHDARTKLLPSYKAHRPPSDPNLTSQKALAEQALSITGFQCVRIDGWEADDILASIGTKHTDVVICSSDKDLLALAGRCRIYHPWGTGSFVTPEEKIGLPAGQITDYLALCGDSSDGIPGVKGIGPTTAVQLLEAHDSLEGILSAAAAGRIKGAVGSKLKEQRSDALMCRQLVELNTALPLPQLRAWSLPAGWQNKLQDLRLGSVAAIVQTLSENSIASPPMPPEETVARICRSIAEPIRTGLSMMARWHGPDRGLIHCWEQGRQLGAAANPWSRQTPNAIAWRQGADGLDLDVDPRGDVPRVIPEAKAAVSSPSKVKSLF